MCHGVDSCPFDRTALAAVQCLCFTIACNILLLVLLDWESLSHRSKVMYASEVDRILEC
jgi:hypothetical protein